MVSGEKIAFQMKSAHRPVVFRALLHSGFTLVELLITIAIIAVLVALVLLGVNKARDMAQGAKCAGNLRQIGTALLSYASDNNGSLVPGAEPEPNKLWYNVLEPYMGSGDVAVDSPDRPAWQQCPSKQFKNKDRFSVGYGWNYTFFGGSWADSEYWKWYYGYGTRLGGVPLPSQTIIIGDSMDVKKATASYQNIYLYFAYDLFTKRHGNKGNYLFLDGHVESLSPEYIRSNDNLLRRDKWQ
jgi:prepilin-type processing-associated H-X9-DG protein/prepilin-type N-terminal cleavage/methylation domain-containing protein